MDVEKLFIDLESNHPQEVENTKTKLAECFNQTKDQWLVQGMMEYYLKTSSLRIIEVLVKVQSPHDAYILDKLNEWIRGQNRVQALTLFGFIVRKHPTWLVKVTKHKLIKEIFRLLQNEKEIVPLISALLCIITLLPIIPSLVPSFLGDLFEVFGHLASWNCQNPNGLRDDQLIHLQLGLHMLFHRLYGMYPWHFITYLKDFIGKEKGAIFQHTIRPLLGTVRVHPMLVTSTKESEVNIGRWKEMEPHDVVVECAKLSLAVFHQDQNPECSGSNASSRCPDTPIPSQLNSICRTPLQSLHSSTGFQSPFQSLMDSEKFMDLRKIDTIWSPNLEILATPPPTGTVPHTPTPSYGVPLISNTSSGTNSLLGVTGSSPPEAAVEATPETTPMKELVKRNNSNSHAVRAILASSQPSSPMRKEQSPFNFPEPSRSPLIVHQTASSTGTTTTLTTMSQQLVMQMLNDRNLSQMQMTTSDQQKQPIGSLMLQHDSQSVFRSNQIASLESPTGPVDSTQEDQEVRELTSNNKIEPPTCTGPTTHSDTLQDISNVCDDCDETERSPCSAGGLHVPTNRSMRLLANGIKRNRMTSCCQNDTSSYLSYGTSPADVNNSIFVKPKVRRTKSWPAIERRPSVDESSTETDNTLSNKQQNVLTNLNGVGVDSSSQSGDDAISATTHFKNLNQKRERKLSRGSSMQKYDLKARNTVSRITLGTQTLQTWPPSYEYSLFELFIEDSKIRQSESCSIFRPQEILNEYIDRTIKLKQSAETAPKMDQSKEQLQLLHLQLQYEQYRREIHAERNRRLMGRSREKRTLEMENDRLRDQLRRFQEDNHTIYKKLQLTKKQATESEQKLQEELNLYKNKFNNETEENKKLKLNVEGLQRHLNEEIKNREEVNCIIEKLRGEKFELQNDLKQAQFQAELGTQYKNELTKLETEFLIMGEVQIKCRDRLNEMEYLRTREEELFNLQFAYNIEINDIKLSLEEKIAQLESAKHRLNELQSQFITKEAVFTDQKRLLKSVKDEYEKKFKALNNKYEVQKAIIVQMEHKIMDLYKNQILSNVAFSPESDKTDFASSMDRTSPLSTSLASSEGLSASLRSVTELCNLQALVVYPNTSSGLTTILANPTAIGTKPSPQKSAYLDSASVAKTTPVPMSLSSPRRGSATNISNTNNPSLFSHYQTSNLKPKLNSDLGPSSSSSSNNRFNIGKQPGILSSTGLASSSSTLVNASVTSNSNAKKTIPTSLVDIPVPGPSQQQQPTQSHSNMRHHFSTPHR